MTERTNAIDAQRILIVEDDADAACVLSMWLRLRGYDVVVTGDGSGALEAVSSARIALVLCDITLPDMSGYEVAWTIRDRGRQCEIPLVAMSGCGQPDDLRKGREAGFDEHLVKPFDLDLLADVVARLAGPPPERSLAMHADLRIGA